MKTAYVHGAQYRANGDRDSVFTVACELRETEAPRNYSRTGYGQRLPTQYMIFFNGKWRRVYCRIYSNSGTLYIGHLREVGERLLVNITEE